MHRTREDSIKSRLTERAQLVIAVEKMMRRGIPEELIPVHLTRAFYVDMDELNAVLDMARAAKEEPSRRQAFRAVARRQGGRSSHAETAGPLSVIP